jgi:hypothetical protein
MNCLHYEPEFILPPVALCFSQCYCEGQTWGGENCGRGFSTYTFHPK